MDKNKPLIKIVDGIWNNQKFGDSAKLNRDILHVLDENKMNLFMLGKSCFYVFNIKSLEMSFSMGSSEVIGYDREEMNLEKLISLVHPSDLPSVFAFEAKVLEFFNVLPKEKIFKYKVRYDYRVLHKEGYYIRILQQVVTLETDENGSIVKTLGVHSDISDLKKEGNPVLSFVGLDGEPTYEDVQTEELFSFLKVEERFSKREKEILNLIIQGRTSEEIAKKLFISKETVNTQRRNMLAKCGVKNTIELVNISVKNGWI